jgi:hypothetical protein
MRHRRYLLAGIVAMLILTVGCALYLNQFRGLPRIMNSLGVKELEGYEREFGADLVPNDATYRSHVYHSKRGTTLPLDSPDGRYTARMEPDRE